MNKKAYIRTIEAVIAILLTFALIISVIPRQPSEKPSAIKAIQTNILEGIEQNPELRDNVLNFSVKGNPYENIILTSAQYTNLNTFLKENTKEFTILEYNFTVCDELNKNCNPDLFSPEPLGVDSNLPNKDIYAKSIMIANSTKARIFRFYIWEKF